MKQLLLIATTIFFLFLISCDNGFINENNESSDSEISNLMLPSKFKSYYFTYDSQKRITGIYSGTFLNDITITYSGNKVLGYTETRNGISNSIKFIYVSNDTIKILENGKYTGTLSVENGLLMKSDLKEGDYFNISTFEYDTNKNLIREDNKGTFGNKTYTYKYDLSKPGIFKNTNTPDWLIHIILGYNELTFGNNLLLESNNNGSITKYNWRNFDDGYPRSINITNNSQPDDESQIFYNSPEPEEPKLLPVSYNNYSFSYDNLNRLSNITSPTGEFIKFIYDGNILTQTISSFKNKKAENRTYTYKGDTVRVLDTNSKKLIDILSITDGLLTSSQTPDKSYVKNYIRDKNGNYVNNEDQTQSYLYNSYKGIFRYCQTPVWALQYITDKEINPLFNTNLISSYMDNENMVNYIWGKIQRNYPLQLVLSKNTYKGTAKKYIRISYKIIN